jgi:hypothetical protein
MELCKKKTVQVSVSSSTCILTPILVIVKMLAKKIVYPLHLTIILLLNITRDEHIHIINMLLKKLVISGAMDLNQR